MNGTMSGYGVGPGSEMEPTLEVVGIFSARGDRGNTDWLSVELSIHTPSATEELEMEGRLWAPAEGRWLRTWDIRHAAGDGTLVRRVSFGPVDALQELRIELAIPTWALLAPQTVAPIELVWDLRLFDESGRCVDTARSESISLVLPVRSSWAGSLANAQLAAALGVATASADGPIGDGEESVIRLAALEAIGPGGAVRRAALDVVECLLDEPVAAWEYLEAFLQAIKPDQQRVAELVELAVRVATVDGKVGPEESILITELKRRLTEQAVGDWPVGTYCIDLDHMELHGPAPGDEAPAAVFEDEARLAAQRADVDDLELDPGAGELPLCGSVEGRTAEGEPTAAALKELCELYEVLADALARQAGFAQGEHRPRPETLVSLLEETGSLSRDMALEVRFVVNLAGRMACGEPLTESKAMAAVTVGREVLRSMGL